MTEPATDQLWNQAAAELVASWNQYFQCPSIFHHEQLRRAVTGLERLLAGARPMDPHGTTLRVVPEPCLDDE